MQIKPENEVRLYKNVPFFVDYKDIILFDNSVKQKEYFNSLPSILYDEVTYTKNSGQIKVRGERDSLLEYNYMSFTNSNYTDKTFYAFVTSIEYVNPNTSLVTFVVDEWQTWCFELEFKESFIERKHCKRWNSDGSPVINTQDEGLDIGSEYIVKYHEQYNNNLYWVCFVTSLEYNKIAGTLIQDVPTILDIYYLPIYKDTNNVITSAKVVTTNTYELSTPTELLDAFRNDENLVNKLVSCFITSEAPFSYNYTITNNQIVLSSLDKASLNISIGSKYKALQFNSKTIPANTLRTFSKYGNLKQNVTESKLLMYPYSFVSLIDGQGGNFDIKLEYLNDTNINIRTFTSGGLNAKQGHIVQNYRYKGVTLNYCRWELGNGVINSFPNNLTIIDDYSAAYIQGNSNQLKQSVTDVMNQSNLNNRMAKITQNGSVGGSFLQGLGTIAAGAFKGAIEGGGKGAAAGGVAGSVVPAAGTAAGAVGGGLVGAAGGALVGGLQALGNFGQTTATSEAYVINTELQGNLSNEKAMAGVLAKKQDINNVADNVALQGGDVYFTYQNQFSGYCLVYKQISDEYISILEAYFKKYGYAYNKIEVPNLHTRTSWDYIRTIDVNIRANINNSSLQKIKTMFNQGVTIWHTTDVANYDLNNDEI